MCDISIRDEFFTIIKAGIQLEVIACHECVKHHLLKTWSGLMKWKNKRCCHLKMGVIDKLCPHISSRPRTDGYKARMTLMTFDFWEKVRRKTLAERRRVVNVRDKESFCGFYWHITLIISLIPILVGLSCSGSKCQKQKEMKMSLLLPKNRKEIKIFSLIFKSTSKEIHLYGTLFYFTNDIINKISGRSVALAFVSSDVFQLPSRGTS